MDKADSSSPVGAARYFHQLGTALQVFRGRAGLSAAELARKARVGKSQLSKYENGKESPKMETLARLLDALHVEPLWFFHLMHQLSREQPVESLNADLFLMREGMGSSISKDAADGFLRVFSDLLALHALMAGERPTLESDPRLESELLRNSKQYPENS
jgi:transcriptional regulator with XRE-family HTH domain